MSCFLATSLVYPDAGLFFHVSGSWPVDHSGHDSLMSALLSASSVSGREPPLRSCRFEAVYCRTREDMSTPKYPLRPVRSTDSPSVRPSVSTRIFCEAYSAFGGVRCPFNLHCARRFLDYLRCLVSECFSARGGGGGSVGRLPPKAVGPWSGSLSLRRGSLPVSYSVENHPRSSRDRHSRFGRVSGRCRLDTSTLAYILQPVKPIARFFLCDINVSYPASSDDKNVAAAGGGPAAVIGSWLGSGMGMGRGWGWG